jgi:hypothetical protein
LKGKPLKEWAGNGPFCAGNGSNEFRYLREDEALAHAVLANCLFSPRIEMRKLANPAGESPRKGDIVVTVHLPKVEEHDVLDARACIEQAKSVDCRNNKVTNWGWQIPVHPYDEHRGRCYFSDLRSFLAVCPPFAQGSRQTLFEIRIFL